MARHLKRDVRLTLSEDDQNTCASILMAMQLDPRLSGMDLKIHNIARQALNAGLEALARKWKVD